MFPLSSRPELPTVADDVDSSGLDQGSKKQQQFGDPNQPLLPFPHKKPSYLLHLLGWERGRKRDTSMFGDFMFSSGEKFEVTGKFPVTKVLILLRDKECDESTLLGKKIPQDKNNLP